MTLAANARPRNPCVDAGRLRLQIGKHGKENIHLEAQLPHGLARGRERAPLPSCCSADSASAIAQRSAHAESHTILRRKRPVLVSLSLARVARRNGLVSEDSLAFDTAASRQGSCPSRLCWVIESRFLRSRDVAPVFLCLPTTVSRANQKSAAGTQNPSGPRAPPWFPRPKTHRLGHRRACPVRFLLSLLERQRRHSLPQSSPFFFCIKIAVATWCSPCRRCAYSSLFRPPAGAAAAYLVYIDIQTDALVLVARATSRPWMASSATTTVPRS